MHDNYVIVDDRSEWPKMKSFSYGVHGYLGTEVARN